MAWSLPKKTSGVGKEFSQFFTRALAFLSSARYIKRCQFASFIWFITDGYIKHSKTACLISVAQEKIRKRVTAASGLTSVCV